MMAQWKRPSLSAAALLLTTLAATATLLARRPSCGHDFDFHLVSWMEAARSWHSGIAYPHWVSSANFGAGEPRFVFYPPASWMLGALLGVIAGWHAAPLLFTAICLLCAGLAMQRLALDYLPPAAATAAACLYIANPYMLFVAYERTAYGELMAAAVLPLLLGFSVRRPPSVPALSVTVGAIWLMNAPSGVIACYTLLWIALVRLASDRSWRAPLRIAAATAIGLALAAFYLVPAATQEHWVEIVRAIGSGMRYQDSFLFHRTGESFHDSVLHTASILACVLLAFGAASWLLWRDSLRRQQRIWLGSLLPLILLLLVPLSAPLWHYAPHLAYVQFPWRWLLVVAPVVALFTIGCLHRRVRTPWLIATTIVLIIAAILPCTRKFHQYCDDEDSVSAQVDLMQSQAGEEGTDEYTPRNDDNAEVAQDLPPVRVLTRADAEEPDSSKQENPEWQPEPTVECHASTKVEQWGREHRTVIIDTSEAGFAVLRLMDYPAWLVRRNGDTISKRPRRDDGLLTVPVPQGRSRIDIQWRTTNDIWTGRLISLLGLCIWFFAWVGERRASRPAPQPSE